MDKINFQNASIITPAKVTIDGTDYNVTPAQLSVVQNYLSAETLNQLQTNIDEGKIDKTIEYSSAGINANELTSTGFYYANASSTNIPSQNGYFINVETRKGGNYILQRAYRVSNNINDFFIYERQYYEGTWTNWSPQTIDSATNANGTYIKYPDGTMICTKLVEGSVDITNTWGQGYTTGDTNTVSLGNFAQTFTAVPIVQVTPARGTNSLNFWLSTIDGTTTQFAGNIGLLRFTSHASVSYKLNVVAIGRWKT